MKANGTLAPRHWLFQRHLRQRHLPKRARLCDHARHLQSAGRRPSDLPRHPRAKRRSHAPHHRPACAGLDENPGICLTHPLDPAQPGRVSISIAWAHNWRWQPLAGDIPAAGLISASGEFQHGQQWWILATDGLYRSTDGGKTLEKVLDETGAAVKQPR